MAKDTNGLFSARPGPVFAIAEHDNGSWALYFCDESGKPHATPLAWVEPTPDGWKISIKDKHRWLPVHETLEMLRRNGLLGARPRSPWCQLCGVPMTPAVGYAGCWECPLCGSFMGER